MGLELTPGVELTPVVELTPAVELTPDVELTPVVEFVVGPLIIFARAVEDASNETTMSCIYTTSFVACLNKKLEEMTATEYHFSEKRLKLPEAGLNCTSM